MALLKGCEIFTPTYLNLVSVNWCGDMKKNKNRYIFLKTNLPTLTILGTVLFTRVVQI